ncbi:MAG: hypothetical protein Q9227_009182 [Pyrenula ochraceoflavens]
MDILPCEPENGKPHACTFCQDLLLDAQEEKSIFPEIFKALCIRRTAAQISTFSSNGCTFFKIIDNTIYARKIQGPSQFQDGGVPLKIVATLRRDSADAPEDYDRIFFEVGYSVPLAWVGVFDVYASEDLPVRVLDVDSALRLKKSQGLQGSYTALSYCWGGPQPVTTTAANLEDHVRGVDFTNLPPTLQDAVTVTRKLGIRYLWIDSLCILQDSIEDKEREIPKMGQIYQNAVVTIIAASARSVSEGFLQQRELLDTEHWSFELGFRFSNDTTGMMIMSPQEKYDAEQEPISARAWTHQERLLSSRRLIYSSRNLLWQCRSTVASDGGRKRDGLFSMDQYNPSSMKMDDWNEIIRSYSRKKTTFPEDKLIAISAIAAQFGKLWPGQYCAGLWLANLKQGLLWRAAKEKDVKKIAAHEIYDLENTDIHQPRNAQSEFVRLRRPKTYIAPSWSWASVDGPVDFPSKAEDYSDLNAKKPKNYDEIIAFFMSEEGMDLEILECTVTPVTQALPFGAVYDGILRLKGHIKRAFYMVKETKLADYKPLPSREDRNCLTSNMFGQVMWDDTGFVEDTTRRENAIEVSCLIIKRTANYAAGLILLPAGEHSERMRRMGFFDLKRQRDGTNIEWAGSNCERKEITII